MGFSIRSSFSSAAWSVLVSWVVGDVVQLEIQKDPVSAFLDAAYDLRTLGVEQLHADLDKGLLAAEAVEKGVGLFRAAEVAGDNHVFSHGRLL